ncbi:MAG: DsbA family protein [Anaerolineae bacterium]|jgi:predicted DsbA family dithiol-disulfide isomerase|nr:DsbA family protein [Anaerolineae bacterium]
MQVDVWSDFMCPWCFLASISLERLAESHGVAITWHSYELRPKGSPPISPDYLKRIDTVRPQMEKLAQEQYGVVIHSGKFGIESRLALIGAKVAEQQGRGAAYHRAMFRAYWTEARDISDLDVVVAVAAAVGLEPAAFSAALRDPEMEALVDADIDRARMLQISGVPAIIFQEKYFISGAQPYEELVNIVGYVRQKEARD